MHRILYLFLPLILILPITGCDSDSNEPTEPDSNIIDFDHQEMLAGWVDNFVVPGHEDLAQSLDDLRAAANATPIGDSSLNLDAMRSAFHEAYLDYQRISPVLIGEAENILLREQFNTYPTNIDRITNNIGSDDLNLELPSNITAQGFPALDYLLYGVDEAVYNAEETAGDYKDYVLILINRMIDLNEAVRSYWTSDNRDAFIANDGNSATASIDRTVNDFIFYYEKFLRAGKVGIPAGVFSDDPSPQRVEAPYSNRSKDYFLEALDATKDFFANHGLADYLDAGDVQRDGELLSKQIIDQFGEAKAKANEIDLTFEEQTATNNLKMLELYNALQRNVVLMKVDMLQALNINVDYVDADGD